MQDEVNELKERYRHECNMLAKDYMVPDILPDTASFIFLLESPHVQELKYGAPVSGPSGASMSRHLFGDAYARLPLGIIVKKNYEEKLHRPSLDRVGLMNVCNIPMQKSAYRDTKVVHRYGELLQVLEGLRTAGQSAVYREATWAIAQEILLHSLRKRLEELWDRELYMIPCGRFAQKFFALVNCHSPNWQVVRNIPHPSYNNWSKPNYATEITHLLTLFASHVDNTANTL